MKRMIIASLLAATITGCNTYQTYERPAEIKTDSLFSEMGTIADTATIASLHWRELFTDTWLQALIERGLRQNADLQVARLRVMEAEATLRASHLAHLPSVSFTPQGGISSFDGGKMAKTYNLAIAAEWETDIFGRLKNTERMAAATVKEREAYRQAVETQLIATIADSYYTLLMLDRQLDISQRTAASWSETIRTLEAKKHVGEATEAAVAQARANQLAVAGSMLALEQQIHEQQNAICLLIGETPREIGRGTLLEQTFPDTLAVGIPLQLLANRPDIRQAEQSLATAYYAVGIARSAFYPSVTLSGSVGWTNSNGADIINPGKWLLNAVGSLVQPIFNHGTIKAQYKIAEAERQEALVAFQQALLNAGAEVNNAVTQWQTANSRLSIDTEQIAALETAVSSTRLLMEHSDETSYLELLTAQQTLLQAELEQASDTFGKIQAVISLYHALGGGCDHPALPQ